MMYQLYGRISQKVLGTFNDLDELVSWVAIHRNIADVEYSLNQYLKHYPDNKCNIKTIDTGHKRYRLALDNIMYLDVEAYEVSDYVMLCKGKMTKATGGSAGWDIYSVESVVVPAGRSLIVKTGIVTNMSPNRCCLILDKSGLAAKSRVTRRAGFIDSDYNLEWGVVLVNEGVSDFQVNVGDKIAQAHFMEVLPWQEFLTGNDNVDGGFIVLDAERTGGFGSTGK